MQCIFENLFNYFFRFLNDWYLSYFNEEFSLLISGYWMNEWIQNVRHLNCFQFSIQVWKLFGNDKRLKLLIINRMKFGVQAYYRWLNIENEYDRQTLAILWTSYEVNGNTKVSSWINEVNEDRNTLKCMLLKIALNNNFFFLIYHSW